MRILLLQTFVAFSFSALAQQYDPTPAVPPAAARAQASPESFRGTGAPVPRPPNSPWVPPSNIPAPATPPANGSVTQPSASTPDILPPATPSRPGSVFQPPNPAPVPPPAPQRPIR